MEKLIQFIEAHGCNAVEFQGRLLVTSYATQQIDGRVIGFEITEKIAPTLRAARNWLGY